MSRSRITQAIALALAAALLFAASTRMPAINAGRKSLNLMASDDVVKQTPPEYAFFIQALGAFRSLIVNIAFIRAEQFKEEGRYFDAMQLAEWICTLQPHFPSVWEFHAWNQSWNISVTTFTAEERWHWVYNGVKLLRDRGLPYNPRATNLYKQLAWTFNNKMSETTDDFHLAYKCNWAWRMHLVLGPPPPPQREIDPNALQALQAPEAVDDLLADAGRKAWEQNEEKRRQTAEARRQPYVPREYKPFDPTASGKITVDTNPTYLLAVDAAREQLRPIHEAPDALQAVFTAHPDARRMVDELRAAGVLLDDGELSEDEYWRGGGLAFEFFQPYRRLLTNRNTLLDVIDVEIVQDIELQKANQLDRILKITADDPAGLAIVHWLQKKVLRDVYRMQTSRMLDLIDNFGPVDWRSVDAQALYWIAEGLYSTGESPNDFRNDKLNTARILFFSMRNLLLRNRIVFEPLPSKIELSYLTFARDLDFVEPMHQAYLRYGPLFDPGQIPVEDEGLRRAGRSFEIGHQNFLAEAIRMLYLAGRDEEAAYYLEYLRQNYPVNEQGLLNPLYSKTLRDFVLDNFLDTTASSPGVREVSIAINSLLDFSLSELARGDFSSYASHNRRARELWQKYMADKQTDPAFISKRLPPFIDMQADFTGVWLAAPPVTPSQTLTKIRVWRSLPLYLRQMNYDRLLPALTEECRAWQFDVGRAFPEPEGMPAFRAAQPQRKQDERPGTEGVETLPPKFGEK